MNASSVNSSDGGGSPCQVHPDSNAVTALKTFAYCFIIIFSLVGNTLVILVVWKVRRMGNNTNRFIVNMCISDLMVTLCVLPPTIHSIYYDSWLMSGPVGEALCKLIPFIQDVSAAVSIFSMTAISLDRFYAIVLPMRTHFMTKRGCHISIGVIWLFASAIHFPYLLILRLREFNNESHCYMNWANLAASLDNKQSQRIYYPVQFVLLYLLPLLVISVLYSGVIWELSRNRQLIDQEQRRIRDKENREVAVMLIVVVLFFAASWAPLNAVAFLIFFTWNWQPPCYIRTFKFVADFLVHSNCAQNSFIYFMFNMRFRRGLKQVVSTYCDPASARPQLDNTQESYSFRKNNEIQSKKTNSIHLQKL
ncbi:neuropeptide FF receptor 1 [Nematostella vectensis]|nr:neuropeptide FF receptor 1 [Nematostella vectensis]